jgi:hypothetical protein
MDSCETVINVIIVFVFALEAPIISHDSGDETCHTGRRRRHAIALLRKVAFLWSIQVNGVSLSLPGASIVG